MLQSFQPLQAFPLITALPAANGLWGAQNYVRV